VPTVVGASRLRVKAYLLTDDDDYDDDDLFYELTGKWS
jgi:hypothetical protein